MTTKEDLANISKHVGILNDEVGKIQVDMKWIKSLLKYVAVIITGIFVSVAAAAIGTLW